MSLFPHRFDFIYAAHSDPSQSPHWQTESRYPLSDRLILEGALLYGVRFSSQTRYCLLDIDAGSAYHPQADAFAIGRILAALEPLGFTDSLACQSSYGGGIHLYLPFQEAQNSWELAACVAALLEGSGFKLKPGQLELFPNPKTYRLSGKPALFNAHRLPMQAGSYLLDQDFQPVWSDRSTFVKRWQFAASRNTVTAKRLCQLLKQHRRKHYRISGKADKFLNDLDTEIEQGWTGQGQTNRLLGRIALRTYIFHHVLQGGEPLTGQPLADQIVAIARSLPGYRDWCRHQHEIELRAAEWASCVESSHYFHYTHHSAVQTAPEVELALERLPSWNQQQTEAARKKIRRAIADLLEQNSLPARATARFQALLRYGIGGGSLYRHRDLWHPNNYLDQPDPPVPNLEPDLSVENSLPVESPPHPPTSSARPPDSSEAKSNGLSCTSLFPGNGGNVSSVQGSADRSLNFSIGRTQEIDRGYQSRMQQYLNSGDPILVTEAKSWRHHQQHQSPEPLPKSGNFQQNAIAFSRLNSAQRSHKDSFRDSSQDSSQNSLQDNSDLLVAISVEIRRLRWTKRQIRDRLSQRYGKTSRAMLSDQQLLDWLTWLKAQATDQRFKQNPTQNHKTDQ